MILENFETFNEIFASVVDKEFPGSGGSYFWNNSLIYGFCVWASVFSGELDFCAHICLHGVILRRLTHRFGGSKPLGWGSPCSEPNLVHLPTSHKITSECFVNTIVLLPPHVNVLVDFHALELKQSWNKCVWGGTAAMSQVSFWLCCWENLEAMRMKLCKGLWSLVLLLVHCYLSNNCLWGRVGSFELWSGLWIICFFIA